MTLTLTYTDGSVEVLRRVRSCKLSPLHREVVVVRALKRWPWWGEERLIKGLDHAIVAVIVTD